MKDITQDIQDSESALKAMLPGEAHLVWELNGIDAHGGEHTLRYVQSELSFFEKQDFITLLGGYIDRFANGEFGIDLKDLFSGDLRSQVSIPTDVSAEDAQKAIEENAELIKTLLKVVNSLPQLQVNLMLLALGVPPNERDFVSEILRGPVWKGGLTDDQAIVILKTFISQNAGPIRDFFSQKGQELVEHFQKEVLDKSTEEKSPSGDTNGGTPSSTTPQQPASTPQTSEPGPPVASS